MNWQHLKIGRNDRAAVIGTTGCGKTTLVKFLLEDKNKLNSVVYNNKPSDFISSWKEPHKHIDTFAELDYEQTPRIIYTPPTPETLSAELQDRFFEWVYHRRYTRLFIDEAGSLRGGTNPVYHLEAIMCRGRERGISTIIGTQRPARIPIILISEAEHFYIFRVKRIEDRQRIYEFTGISIDEQTDLNKHEFIYYNDLTGFRSPKLVLNPESVTR